MAEVDTCAVRIANLTNAKALEAQLIELVMFNECRVVGEYQEKNDQNDNKCNKQSRY